MNSWQVAGAESAMPRRASERTALLPQPFEPALAFDDVFVVPLDVAGIGEPAFELGNINLVGGGVALLGRLELALRF
ncbi:hypothetical protein OT109_02390 [Phycisphaeraceae bacterium D3-23]